MPLKTFRPLTPAQRYLILNVDPTLAKKRPERKLTESLHKTGGRNCYGRLTSRRRGGGHKRLYRIIDFRRARLEEPAKVEAIEYDPNRTANLALIVYPNGDKNYILAPKGLVVGATVISSDKVPDEFLPGCAYPLSIIPPTTFIHALEMLPGRGAAVARSAGNHAQIVNIDADNAQVRLPSGEIRIVNKRCRATIGEVGNADHMNQSLGKAGRNRWLGRRPRVRGVAMNPVDHPNGGGQGKSKGGGGRQQLVSPWGQLAKSFPTRKRSKPSNALIITRKNGRPPRGKK
jgi:large subunit ribosomal protein L2